MHISSQYRILILTALGVALLVFACGDDQTAQEPGGEDTTVQVARDSQPEPIIFDHEDWLTFSHENVKVVYPPDHPHAEAIGDLPQILEGIIRSDCRFLGIDVPTDTIVLFYHSGPYAGRQATHREFPFAIGDTLHHFPPFQIGTLVMKYLIPKWQSAEPRHSFLKHGLLALLDYSQRDPHKRTFDFIDSNKFIPLRELAVDVRINSEKEYYQSAEAASFVDFIVLQYGQRGLSKLYLSDTTFDMSTVEVFGIDPDSLERTWLHVVDSVRTWLQKKR